MAIAIYSTIPVFAQWMDNSNYYYSDGKRIMLSLSNEEFAVRFKEDVTDSQIKVLLATEPEIEPIFKKNEIPNPRLRILKFKSGLGNSKTREIINKFNNAVETEFASPILLKNKVKYIGVNIILGADLV